MSLCWHDVWVTPQMVSMTPHLKKLHWNTAVQYLTQLSAFCFCVTRTTCSFQIYISGTMGLENEETIDTESI